MKNGMRVHPECTRKPPAAYIQDHRTWYAWIRNVTSSAGGRQRVHEVSFERVIEHDRQELIQSVLRSFEGTRRDID